MKPIKLKIPKGQHFDGAEFGRRFLPNFNESAPDGRFWVDGEGWLQCPSLDVEPDISVCILEDTPEAPSLAARLEALEAALKGK